MKRVCNEAVIDVLCACTVTVAVVAVAAIETISFTLNVHITKQRDMCILSF